MKITSNFMELATELDAKYFPDVKYYRDNKNDEQVHYTIELFNNGCMDYTTFIKRLFRNCKDTKENLHTIVSKYIKDFEGFEYKSE